MLVVIQLYGDPRYHLCELPVEDSLRSEVERLADWLDQSEREDRRVALPYRKDNEYLIFRAKDILYIQVAPKDIEATIDDNVLQA